jgi:hypothetical protein
MERPLDVDLLRFADTWDIYIYIYISSIKDGDNNMANVSKENFTKG